MYAMQLLFYASLTQGKSVVVFALMKTVWDKENIPITLTGSQAVGVRPHAKNIVIILKNFFFLRSGNTPRALHALAWTA